MADRHHQERRPPPGQRPGEGNGWARCRSDVVDGGATIWRMWSTASDGSLLAQKVLAPDYMVAALGRRWIANLLRRARCELNEERRRREWSLGDYANGDTGCPHCGRMRLCRCPNGKHRCEKCNWSPELGGYAPVND